MWLVNNRSAAAGRSSSKSDKESQRTSCRHRVDRGVKIRQRLRSRCRCPLESVIGAARSLNYVCCPSGLRRLCSSAGASTLKPPPSPQALGQLGTCDLLSLQHVSILISLELQCPSCPCPSVGPRYSFIDLEICKAK